MKTRLVSTALGLTALLLAVSSVAKADGFDLTGTTVSSTLIVAGNTFTTGPATVTDGMDFDNDYPTRGGSEYVADGLGILFDVSDDTSTYTFSDHQGVLLISYTPNPPIGPAYTLQSGVSFVIKFNFFSPEAQTITDFQFVQGTGTANLVAGFTSQFDAHTSTLTLTSTQDIQLPAGSVNTIEGRFLASPIPEPATAGVFAGAAAIAAFACLRRRRL